MKFPIGSRAWAWVLSRVSGEYSYVDFTVVGRLGSMRALLIDPSLTDFDRGITITCDPVHCEDYQIDYTYLDKEVLFVREWHLLFLGRVCTRCGSHFDYLHPQQGFVCWKCEI